ncbi:MAG: TIGR02300 family protein [Alphaproteobacteria bacterium]|nr:TIGR02300 family protein [Alphaproteobacteria bacterium]
MAKAEWGAKRICLSCGARFYDMRANPITCPKCGSEHAADDFVTRRRTTRPAPVEVKPVEEAKKPDKDPDEDEPVVEDDDDDDEELSEVEDDSDDDVIEDTSDLGEDDDDMAEVLEHTEAEDKE